MLKLHLTTKNRLRPWEAEAPSRPPKPPCTHTGRRVVKCGRTSSAKSAHSEPSGLRPYTFASWSPTLTICVAEIVRFTVEFISGTRFPNERWEQLVGNTIRICVLYHFPPLSRECSRYASTLNIS